MTNFVRFISHTLQFFVAQTKLFKVVIPLVLYV